MLDDKISHDVHAKAQRSQTIKSVFHVVRRVPLCAAESRRLAFQRFRKSPCRADVNFAPCPQILQRQKPVNVLSRSAIGIRVLARRPPSSVCISARKSIVSARIFSSSAFRILSRSDRRGRRVRPRPLAGPNLAKAALLTPL